MGDIQRTGLAERAIARRQNNRVRTEIIDEVRREQPDLLLLLGDQVVDGSSRRDWAYFDRIMAGIRHDDIPVFALLGNHDYGRLDRQRGLRRFHSHFPGQSIHLPEVVRVGPVALVSLDSNFARLTADEIFRQASKYAALMQQLDNDPDVAAIIVASHHPPYTNSRLRTDERITAMFALPFLESAKSRLYLSAHIHSYERFAVGEKLFVVSGGGGGPRRRVSIGPERTCTNDLYCEGELRPFHFLRLTLTDQEIRGETVMLREEKRTRWRLRPGNPPSFEVGDTFTLSWSST